LVPGKLPSVLKKSFVYEMFMIVNKGAIPTHVSPNN